MFHNARGAKIKIGRSYMEYVTFGSGTKTLVIIPGLGDSIKNVHGLSIPLSIMNHKFAQEFKVYIFSRKNTCEKDYSIECMAKDQADAMNKLGIEKAYVIGISQGGMISQCLAAFYPNLVEKLVLVVTICKQNENTKSVIGRWRDQASRGDIKSVLIDISEKTYKEKTLKKMRGLYPALSLSNMFINKRKFVVQATACLKFDAEGIVEKIKCPTLIVGGGKDTVVGQDSAFEIAQRIPGSMLHIYKHIKHGLYYEAVGFRDEVIYFLKNNE